MLHLLHLSSLGFKQRKQRLSVSSGSTNANLSAAEAMIFELAVAVEQSSGFQDLYENGFWPSFKG